MHDITWNRNREVSVCDHAVDADHATLHVGQWPARFPRREPNVGGYETAAPRCVGDAQREGALDPMGVPHRDEERADAQILRVADRRCRKSGCRDPQFGKVAFDVAGFDLRGEHPSVGELDIDAPFAHDVRVRDDDAVARPNDAGTRTAAAPTADGNGRCTQQRRERREFIGVCASDHDAAVLRR